MWMELFDGDYATGENVVAPSMYPNYVQQREHVNMNLDEGDNESGVEDNHHSENDRDHVYSKYNRYALPSHGVGSAQVPIQGKRKRRQSGRAVNLSRQIDILVSNSSKALEILRSQGNVSKDSGTSFTVKKAVTVINRMVNECVLEEGCELWCYALSFIENEVRREILLSLEDDVARKVWLMYMHAKEK
ncbi:hypothetical protein SESBI_31998 [Sesbania bispinosa]|nr:hypothetical protein SESBI_31998 [Sesbania bispinosa]